MDSLGEMDSLVRWIVIGLQNRFPYVRAFLGTGDIGSIYEQNKCSMNLKSLIVLIELIYIYMYIHMYINTT